MLASRHSEKIISNDNNTSVTPNGMFPTYNRLACRVIVDPTTGTAVCGVSGMVLAGICPAAKQKPTQII